MALTRTEIEALPLIEQAQHFRQLAEAHMEKREVTWQEACRQIKKRYPTAHAAFMEHGKHRRVAT
jgi:hypothetical protein